MFDFLANAFVIDHNKKPKCYYQRLLVFKMMSFLFHLFVFCYVTKYLNTEYILFLNSENDKSKLPFLLV